jgi:hypothetical protein
VRIRRDALAVDFLPEHVELRFGEPALEECARVDARRGVALEIDEVAAVLLGRCVPEMVEPHVVERGSRCEARDVAAQLEVLLSRTQYHRHGIPTHDGSQAMLELVVAGRVILQVRRNRVDIRSLRAVGEIGARAASLVDELFEDEVRAIRSLDLEHRIKGVDPFAGLEGIDVLEAVHGSLIYGGGKAI